MNKTVYAVSSGCYSDYRIDAMFSTRRLAKEFMSAVQSNDYNEIAEYELDPKAADLIKRGYSMWDVHMLRDGTTERVERTESDTYNMYENHWIWERTQAPAYEGKGIPDILRSTVWAKTEKQAIKFVNRQRTQMIAKGEWR